MNERDSNELKRGAGYLKEKAIIGLTRVTGDELDRAIMKVTSHMLKAPKEKHMQRLLAASYGHYKSDTRDGKSICEYIILELEKRMHTHNWIVVLKSLVTLHRLMTDGSGEINVCIQRNRNIFCARNLKDLSENAEGFSQGLFIRQYLRYLEERASSRESLGNSGSLESLEFGSALRSLDVDSLTPLFRVLLKQLCALVDVEYREAIVDNFCTLEAYQKLVDDGRVLYQLLSNRVIFILDGFDDFSLHQKKIWLDLYRQFGVVAEGLRFFFNSILNSSKIFEHPPPQLKPLPFSMLERLEDDVRFSSIPKEDVTETLESLGITKEKTRASVEEAGELPLPLSQYAEIKKTVPDQKPSLSLPTEIYKTNEAPIMMDDLFVGITPPMADNFAPAGSTVKNEQIPLFSPKEAEEAGAPIFESDHVMRNPVFDDGWSSGAPVSCRIDPSAEYQVSALVATVTPHGTWCEASSLTNEANLKKSEGVFKELYTEGQKGWSNKNA